MNSLGNATQTPAIVIGNMATHDYVREYLADGFSQTRIIISITARATK
jgi:hypothetical protein